MKKQALQKISKLLEKYTPQIKKQEIAHLKQVATFSKELWKKNKNSKVFSEKIVTFTAIIHDIGRYIPDVRNHTQITLKEITKYIDIPFLSKDQIQIIKAIQHHSLSSKNRPQSMLDKIIFDADNLTIFTPLGIARWYFKAESWGKVNLEEATATLIRISKQAQENKLFYLRQSWKVFKRSNMTSLINQIQQSLRKR